MGKTSLDKIDYRDKDYYINNKVETILGVRATSINKEKKEVILNPFERHQIQVYKCQECGKEIILDNELMEQLNVYQGRDITEENFENENPQVLEFMDMQISEQTFGKRLCSDCLKKYLKDKNLI